MAIIINRLDYHVYYKLTHSEQGYQCVSVGENGLAAQSPVACSPQQLDTLKGSNIFVEFGPNVGNNINHCAYLLMKLCQLGNLEIIQSLFYFLNSEQKQACLSAIYQETGDSPLHMAVKCNHTHIAQYLINQGAAKEARNEANETPLYVSVIHDNADMITMLHEAGVEINSENGKLNQTPLHGAAYYGKLNTIKALIESGANVEARARNNCTPLYTAVRSDHLEVVQYLCEVADINSRNHLGTTPLCSAVYNRQNAIIELLMAYGADPLITTDTGHAAADIARVVAPNLEPLVVGYANQFTKHGKLAMLLYNAEIVSDSAIAAAEKAYENPSLAQGIIKFSNLRSAPASERVDQPVDGGWSSSFSRYCRII